MNFLHEIVNNIALIVVLSVAYSFLYRRFAPNTNIFKILSGFLFGIIALMGMFTPVNLGEGIIFDGRSIIISIAGYLGGPITAIISALMTSLYRLWTGGDGVMMGILVISSSAAIGVIYHYIRKKNTKLTKVQHYFIFGIIVHIFMLLFTMALPSAVRFQILEKIAIPVILIYPAATVLICLVLQGQEEKIVMRQNIIANEERLRMVLSNMPVMLVAFDRNYNIIEWNNQCVHITGYEKEEIIGNNKALEILVPEKKYRKNLISILKKKGEEFLEFESKLKCKDGNEKIISWSTISEQIKITGWHTWAIGYDITKRTEMEEKNRQALKEKDTLLKEVHHRVKNNMQIISSLLSLELSNTDNKKIKETFQITQNRIRSIALVHEKLYKTEDISVINLSALVKSLANDLILSFSHIAEDVSIQVETKNILIGIEQAIPCALILNELLTNSLKYAFPDHSGEIIISGETNEDGKNIIAVEDNGIGLPDDFDIKNGKTLGYQIISELVKQINGTIEISGKNGAKHTIVF